jgi:hypothetical protein
MLRSLRLARIAAEAEGLRLQRLARRTAIRIVLGLVALFFLFCAFAVFHVGVWFLLRNDLAWEAQTAGLAMAGFDLFVAVVIGLCAAMSSPGRVEREALDVRRRALENATTHVGLSAALVPALRLTVSLMRRARGK